MAKNPLAPLLPKLDRVGLTRVRAITLSLVAAPLVALAIALSLLPRALWVPKTPSEFWTAAAGLAAVGALAATIGVGAVAWFGLRSLRLARQDIEIRAVRESRLLAFARAEQFSALLKERNMTISAELGLAKIPSFTLQIRAGVPVFEEPSLRAPALAWWRSVPAETQSRIIYFLNDLEAWAMYFTQEMADAKAIQAPCAPTFCGIVMQYAPWIITARADQSGGFYSNIVSLFDSWRSELEADARGKSTEAAVLAARAAEERRARLQMRPPLGTNLDG